MDHPIKKKENKRIEFRVSPEDKELFEYAKSILGYTSISEFIRYVLIKESRSIVEERNRILASQRDKEIFFNALMGKEEAPNAALLEAIEYHRNLVK